MARRIVEEEPANGSRTEQCCKPRSPRPPGVEAKAGAHRVLLDGDRPRGGHSHVQRRPRHARRGHHPLGRRPGVADGGGQPASSAAGTSASISPPTARRPRTPVAVVTGGPAARSCRRGHAWRSRGATCRCAPGATRCRGVGGRVVPVYLLDTDLEENAEGDRRLTDHLYGGDARYRLCQEVILGIGGVRMLRALGYANIRRFHMNEGHASLLDGGTRPRVCGEGRRRTTSRARWWRRSSRCACSRRTRRWPPATTSFR